MTRGKHLALMVLALGLAGAGQHAQTLLASHPPAPEPDPEPTPEPTPRLAELLTAPLVSTGVRFPVWPSAQVPPAAYQIPATSTH